MPDMLRRFHDRSDKGKLLSLERQALKSLEAWITAELKDKSAAWTRLLEDAEKWIEFKKEHEL